MIETATPSVTVNMQMTESLLNNKFDILKVVKDSILNPPWTFVNLFLYMFSQSELLRRGFYASICATAVAFEMVNIIYPGYHCKLWEKLGLNGVLFYIFDITVHWIPVVMLYQPPLESLREEVLSKGIAFSCNLVLGLLVSRGTMNLSSVYAFLEMRGWWLCWAIVFVTTILAP